MSDSQSREEGGRLSWSDNMQWALIKALALGVTNGQRSDSGWKPATWKEALLAVQRAAPPSEALWVTLHKLRSKVENLKKDYKAWVAITNLSGWTIDDRGLPSAPEQVMKDYFEAHKDARKFKKAPLDNEAELAFLFDGTLATGAHAAGISTAQKRSQARAKALSDMKAQGRAAVHARAAAIVTAATGGSRERSATSEGTVESTEGDDDPDSILDSSGSVSDAALTAAQISMRKRAAEGFAKEKRKASKASGPEHMGGAVNHLAECISKSSTVFTTETAPTPVQRAARIVWSSKDRFSVDDRMLAALRLTKRALAEMFIEAPEEVQMLLVEQYVLEERSKRAVEGMSP